VTAEHPHAAELLALARETLLGELADAVPPDKRYTLLMVANAMAIAGREIEGREALQQDALADLCRLYGEPVEGASVAAVERRLADDIRKGRFDGGPGDRLREALLRRVRAQLAVSNPKALAPGR
jgi:hypothetical protein